MNVRPRFNFIIISGRSETFRFSQTAALIIIISIEIRERTQASSLSFQQ